jgi:hypothetical protein
MNQMKNEVDFRRKSRNAGNSAHTCFKMAKSMFYARWEFGGFINETQHQ